MASSLALLPGGVQAQTVNFGSLSYGGACDWSGGAEIGAYQGLELYGLRALDLNNYQKQCWGNGGATEGIANGYVGAAPSYTPLANVVGLGTFAAFIQRAGASPFDLVNMQVGAGWTPTALTFKGYTSLYAPDLLPSFERAVTIQPSGLTSLSFDGWTGLNYLRIEVDYLAGDPYGSIDYRALANNALGFPQDGLPYETYFVSAITTRPTAVPEPASLALLGAGLLGLGAVARRRARRTTRG